MKNKTKTEVNHELLFKEKDILKALKKHDPKLGYNTSSIAASLDTIRQEKNIRGHDFGLTDDMCASGPRSWQMVQARRIACMLRHISKAERAAKPPMWTKLLFADADQAEQTQVDCEETQAGSLRTRTSGRMAPVVLKILLRSRC